MGEAFKVGDKVKHIGDSWKVTYTVHGVFDVYLWLKTDGGDGPPHNGIAAVYERVPTEFRLGKSYRFKDSVSTTVYKIIHAKQFGRVKQWVGESKNGFDTLFQSDFNAMEEVPNET